jgi:hypothetical protein
MVTVVPPEVGPKPGLTAVTVGTAANVKLSAALVGDVPPTLLTVTSTAPALSAGVFTVQVVAALQDSAVPGDVPN